MKKLFTLFLLSVSLGVVTSEVQKSIILFNTEQAQAKIKQAFGGVFTDAEYVSMSLQLVGKGFTVVKFAQTLDKLVNKSRDSKMEPLKGGPAKTLHNRVNSSKEQLLDDLLRTFHNIDDQEIQNAKKALTTELWK